MLYGITQSPNISEHLRVLQAKILHPCLLTTVLMKALICSSLLILPAHCGLAALCPGKLQFNKLHPNQSIAFHWCSNSQDCYKNGEPGDHMITLYYLHRVLYSI